MKILELIRFYCLTVRTNHQFEARHLQRGVKCLWITKRAISGEFCLRDIRKWTQKPVYLERIPANRAVGRAGT